MSRALQEFLSRDGILPVNSHIVSFKPQIVPYFKVFLAKLRIILY